MSSKITSQKVAILYGTPVIFSIVFVFFSKFPLSVLLLSKSLKYSRNIATVFLIFHESLK